MLDTPPLDAQEAINPELRKLYPHYTDEQLRIAQVNLRRYVEVVKRIVERQVDSNYKRGIIKGG